MSNHENKNEEQKIKRPKPTPSRHDQFQKYFNAVQEEHMRYSYADFLTENMLKKEFDEYQVSSKADIRVVDSHGEILTNRYLAVPKNTIIVMMESEGNIMWDYSMNTPYKNQKGKGKNLVFLFIQYLLYLVRTKPHKQLSAAKVKKYYKLLQAGVSRFENILKSSCFYSCSNYYFPQLTIYYENDVIPDELIDFEDPLGEFDKLPFGIHEWHSYMKIQRMRKNQRDGLQSASLASVRARFGSLTVPMSSIIHSLLLEKQFNDKRLNVYFFPSCRGLISPLRCLKLIPNTQTLFKDLFHKYIADNQRLFFPNIDFVAQNVEREFADTLQEFQSDWDNLQGAKNYVRAMQPLLKYVKLFYAKVCFGIPEINNSLNLYYTDYENYPVKVELGTRTLKNKMLPVRKDGQLFDFGFQKTCADPGPSSSKCEKRDALSLYYYYPDNKQGDLLYWFFVTNKQSLDISSQSRSPWMYPRELREIIFDLWSRTAFRTFKDVMWPPYQSMMRELFVEAKSFEQLTNKKYVDNFLKGYTIFYSNKVSNNNYYDLERKARDQNCHLFISDATNGLNPTIEYLNCRQVIRRGFDVPFMTPLEYAIANYFLMDNGTFMPLLTALQYICAERKLFGDLINDLPKAISVLEQKGVTIDSDLDKQAKVSFVLSFLSEKIKSGESEYTTDVPLSFLLRLQSTTPQQSYMLAMDLLDRFPAYHALDIRRQFMLCDLRSLFTAEEGLIRPLIQVSKKFYEKVKTYDSSSIPVLMQYYFLDIFLSGSKKINIAYPSPPSVRTFDLKFMLLLDESLSGSASRS